MFELCQFNPNEACNLASFLNNLRQNHWTLTSLAYLHQPDVIPQATAEELIQVEAQPNRIGTFLLKHNGRIISVLQLDDKYGDGKIAVFSSVETHPDYQRRGTFWRHLLNPCLQQICEMGYDRLEAITWTFNRKGIPLYKRIGFRAVPGTSLIMENYFPLILKHPAVQDFFSRHDYIRTLQNERSYGYDSLNMNELDVFEYRWKSQEDELIVYIDWRRQQIAAIQRQDWAVKCFVVGECPFRIRYQVENRMLTDMPFKVQAPKLCDGNSSTQVLLGSSTISGEINITDPTETPIPRVTVDMYIAGERVSFPIRRFQEMPSNEQYSLSA